MDKVNGRLKIKDLPLSERPYEKLENLGPEMLSTAELLAIIIRTGNRNETSVALAQKILKLGEDRGLSFLYDMSLEELKKIQGIGRVKAIQLKAMAEFAKRMASSGRQGKNFSVKSPGDIAALLMPDMRYLKKEVFKTVLLDTKNHILKIVNVSVGSLTASIVHPREVFAEAVKVSSCNIIFVHNHPSGDPEPSREDVETTSRLVGAGNILGIKVLDHIIIGDGRYVSLKEKGFID